ncbi:hypothetical protein EMIHUDRAFT_227541 [Emiliania huxleyi CCMP1516]|uniref:Uncharacterized protein n=2 Tax=Emiliania huxleyi TaxID=2903 RepID=A0A0D3KHL0_EMIH1|nr:hypothetical protein EMIHUDRAFT_227541 [Emiliania huxleyi CCMP1516]EOD35245.1 hypothetical protein EMIHUDRAFT_227541 [Emiliania huxleyi CCMP1516]|eukprot:XP_005787674.1 hypothetical protein EMIHUDRAFT_227541 [Emiliania huxleyi CCMP1516]
MDATALANFESYAGSINGNWNDYRVAYQLGVAATSVDGAAPQDAARAASELASIDPDEFPHEPRDRRSHGFAGSSENEIVGLLRQPVGKWRSSPATGARAKITSFYTGEDGATTVKLAVIVTEGDDEAAIEMPIPEFLSSYPAGAGAEGDAADAGAGDAEPAYAALRALLNTTRGFSASDVADEAGEEELDAFRAELYKAKELGDHASSADRKERLVAADEAQLRTGGSAPTIKTAGILAMRFLNSVGTAAAAPAPTATGTQAQGGPALERQPAGVAEPAFLHYGAEWISMDLTSLSGVYTVDLVATFFTGAGGPNSPIRSPSTWSSHPQTMRKPLLAALASIAHMPPE